MNNTTLYEEPEFNSYKERLVVAIFLLVVFAIGTIGNLMVIGAVLISRTLRTRTNVFVVNLTLADLFACLAMPWWSVALLSGDEWLLPGAEWICQVSGMVLFISLGNSLWNLAFISVNRLILITRSLKTYQRIYTATNIAIMVLFAWSVAILLVSTPTFLGFGEIGFDRTTHVCTDVIKTPKAVIYDFYQAIVTGLLLVIIIGSYIGIYVHIRRHFRSRKHTANFELSSSMPTLNMDQSDTPTCEDQSDTPTCDHQSETPTRDRRSRNTKIDRDMIEITKNLFMVVCILIICLLPIIVVNSISLPDSLQVYAHSIAFANSAMNPVIYAWRHPHFKVVLRLMLKCRYADVPQPSSFLRKGV